MYLRPIVPTLALVAAHLLAASLVQAAPKKQRQSASPELRLLRHMTSWAKQIDDHLRQVSKASRRRLEKARVALAKAAGLRPKPLPMSETMRPEPLWVSKTLPGASSRSARRGLATVPPDDFYLHGEVRFPSLWIRRPTRVRVTWLLFDGRPPPTLASALDRRALYVRSWSPRTVASERMRFYERVSGLGLLPGRYVAVMHLTIVDGPYPRPEQLTFGALRVAEAGAPKVSVLRPHHLGWYKSRAQLLELEGLRLRPRSGVLVIKGRLRRHRAARVHERVLLEVVAESGFRKHVLYRAYQQLRRGTRAVSLTVPHGLPPGPYKIKIAVYFIVSGRGYATFQRKLVSLLGASSRAPAQAKKTPDRAEAKVAMLLLRYLRYQANASRRRDELRLLQRTWRQLLAPHGRSWPKGKAPQRGFQLAEVAVSAAGSLHAARLAPQCLGVVNCRIWLRVQVAPGLHRAQLEASAELRHTSGKRFAIPLERHQLYGGEATLALRLSRANGGPMPAGSYHGLLQVRVGAQRAVQRKLAFLIGLAAPPAKKRAPGGRRR